MEKCVWYLCGGRQGESDEASLNWPEEIRQRVFHRVKMEFNPGGGGASIYFG